MRNRIVLHEKIGLAGVPGYENAKARFLYQLLRSFELVVIIGLALQWHMEWQGELTDHEGHLFNVVTWLFFTVELFILYVFVNHRRSYLVKNSTKIGLIILGIPLTLDINIYGLLLMHARLALVLILLTPWLEDCRQSLSDNRLTTTLIATAVIAILAGIFISATDPAVHSIREGVWWAWVTITTVGYGDVVPVTDFGRAFASLLMMLGLALFAVITANFSAIFIHKRGMKDAKRENHDITRILNSLRQVRKDEQEILQLIEAIQQRLDHVEQLAKRQRD